MSDESQRYRRLADQFARTIAEVPEDRWSAPSPCEGWTARDVVRHVVDTHGLFLSLFGRSMPAGPSVDDDPGAAFEHVRGVVQADLEDPERAAVEKDGPFGRRSFASAIDLFLSGDLLIHRWDLGTAAGLEVVFSPAEIERAWADTRTYGEAARQPGVFGPELEAPADADEQTRLLAFLGRRAG
jgi:uncharacterized protein (TIGR03086 family)